MKADIRKKIAAGLLWTFGERILAQGVSFAVSIVLARLLLPEEYGVISLVLIFINIANVFVSDGLGTALVQKKDATEDDFSTMFCCSCILAGLLYAVLFFSAPWIAQFYNESILVPVIRVLGIKLPVAALNGIQHAYISKNLQFKKFFFSTLGGTIFSGFIGIVMAVAGYGVWALIAQYLINSAMDTIILLLTVRWKPSFKFKWESVKRLAGFGGRMMCSSLINTIYSEMQSLVIGKVYSASDLAYHRRGKQFPSLFITNICSAISTVLFPTIANKTNGLEEVKLMTQKAMQTTSYIITPLMVGLIATSEPLVKLLLTDKWLPCVPYMQILSFAYLFQPIQTATCQAIKAIGRSDVYLKTEIIKKTIGFILLLFALHKGVMAITVAFMITVMLSAIVTMIAIVSLLQYNMKEQVFDLLPSILISGVMFAVVYPLTFLEIPSGIVLLLQIITGISVYIGVSLLTKNESLGFLLSYLKGQK